MQLLDTAPYWKKESICLIGQVLFYSTFFNFLYIKDYFCFQSGGTIEGQVCSEPD